MPSFFDNDKPFKINFFDFNLYIWTSWPSRITCNVFLISLCIMPSSFLIFTVTVSLPGKSNDLYFYGVHHINVNGARLERKLKFINNEVVMDNYSPVQTICCKNYFVITIIWISCVQLSKFIFQVSFTTMAQNNMSKDYFRRCLIFASRTNLCPCHGPCKIRA